MKKFAFGAAVAALALAVPAAAPAQQLPPAVVAVVDTGRILQQCTACVAANAQLQAQQQSLEQRAQQLGLIAATPNTPAALEIELQALQTAANALPPGAQPDAALQARFQAYQTNVQNAQREVATREEQLRRNTGHVLQQIDQRLNPIILQVMQQRGANIVVARGSTIMHNPAVEITDAVLALLNQQLPSVSVNAPPVQQQQQQPPAQQPQQQQPRRPQGR